MSDVHRSAAALLHRVADGGDIPIAVLRGFAELVLHSELVAGARAVLDGPPDFALRRARDLRRQVMKRERRNQAHDTVRNPRGHRYKIRRLQSWQGCEPIHSSAGLSPSAKCLLTQSPWVSEFS